MGEQDEQVRGIRTPCEITCAYKVHVPSTLEAGRGVCSPDVLTSAAGTTLSWPVCRRKDPGRIFTYCLIGTNNTSNVALNTRGTKNDLNTGLPKSPLIMFTQIKK